VAPRAKGHMPSQYAILLTVIATTLAASERVAAQGVRYWENVANPSKNLEFDHRQCVEYGRSYSDAMMQASMPASVQIPNTLLGRAVAGMSTVALQYSAQRYFDQGFVSCMTQLGWREVGASELAAREASAQRRNAASVAAAERERAVSEQLLREYKTRVPEINVAYDEFDQDSIISTTLTYLPNSRDLLGFLGGSMLVKPRDPADAGFAALVFRAIDERATIGTSPRIIVLVDHDAPIRIEDQLVRYSADTTGGLVTEDVAALMTPSDLRRLVAGTLIRVRVGLVEFTLPDTHRAVLRMMLADHMP
jgi:hypothetical protein